jgi:hypothetical protein
LSDIILGFNFVKGQRELKSAIFDVLSRSRSISLKFRSCLKAAKFRLRVLPPVHFDVAPGQERYSRSRVMDESERIRVTVQEALYDMLRTRRSVWFG